MKKIFIFKRRIQFYILTCCMCLFVLTSTAQNQKVFIEFITSPELTQQQDHYAQKWISSPYVFNYQFCRIQKELLENETLGINLLDQGILQVNKRKTVQRTGKMFSWFGDPQTGDGNINFVVNNEHVTGWIFCKEGTYYIYPIGEGLHIMYDCIEDGIPEHKDCVQKDKSNTNEQHARDTMVVNPLIDPETGIAKMSATGDCKVRLAVCYTDDVAADQADIASFVQQCIDVTNECLVNSEVNFEVELARSYENSYVEPGSAATILDNWMDISDGLLDEISTVRTYYDADLNVLLVDYTESENCGRAPISDIATASNNFCILQDGCALANQYTFPHEIAHLFGCNHDPYVTVDPIPYSYGHGHVNIVDGWRTVMAYTDFCDTLGLECGRIPYFSNPDVYYDGSPTGTTDFFPFTTVTSDNARVLNNTVDDISSIEITLSNKVLPSENIYSGEAGDVIALTSTTHSGDYIIHSGGAMTFRAGDYVTLLDGFLAEAGSNFSAYIDDCVALRIASSDPEESTMDPGNTIMIYPNPSFGIFTIDISGFHAENKNTFMRIFDASGKVVWENSIDAEETLLQLNFSQLPKGIYTLLANNGLHIMSEKLILQ
ncbi:MAG: zinc-dependent metalloprotease [Chitinophagales bacterium]